MMEKIETKIIIRTQGVIYPSAFLLLKKLIKPHLLIDFFSFIEYNYKKGGMLYG